MKNEKFSFINKFGYLILRDHSKCKTILDKHGIKKDTDVQDLCRGVNEEGLLDQKIFIEHVSEANGTIA